VPRVRLPWDVISNWPKTRTLTFSKAGSYDQYAVAIVDGIDSAEQAALGLNQDTLDWKTASMLSEASIAALAGAKDVEDPYLVVHVVPWRPSGVFGTPSDRSLEAVVRLATGDVLYSKREFPPDVQAPYNRAAMIAFDGDKLWAVKPKDRQFWTLPGGHINPDEKSYEAAEREMQEETGVVADVSHFIGMIYRPWSSTFVYLGSVKDQKKIQTPDEIEQAALVDIDLLTPAERIFVKKNYRDAAKAVSVQREAEFDPEKHPRGEHGQFAPTGAPSISEQEQEFLQQISADPEVQKNREMIRTLPDTKKGYENNPIRMALQDQWVKEKFEQSKNAIPEPGQKPTLTLIIGPPASGKTTVIKPVAPMYARSVNLDVDEAKAAIPEYSQGILPAALVHEESGDMVEKLQARAVAAKRNIVLDVTGKSYEKTLSKVQAMKDQGYEVDLYRTHLSPLDSARNAYGRYKTSGRFVDPEFILTEVRDKPADTYERLKQSGLLRSWASYDTTDMRAPRLIDRGQRD